MLMEPQEETLQDEAASPTTHSMPSTQATIMTRQVYVNKHFTLIKSLKTK